MKIDAFKTDLENAVEIYRLYLVRTEGREFTTEEAVASLGRMVTMALLSSEPKRPADAKATG